MVSTIKKISPKYRIIIVDCLTLLLSNLMLKGYNEKIIEEEIIKVMDYIKKLKDSEVIIVSNEVGLGIVPGNKLGRDFRDMAGRINQIVAACAYDVFFIAAGIPIKIKEGNG